LLSTVYPSLIEALPTGARAPVLDTIAALQYRLAEHIAAVLKSEQTAEAIEKFVDRQVDKLLERKLDETVSEETFTLILQFAEDRIRGLVGEAAFEAKVRVFVGERLDDLARTDATLAEMFTPETIALIKERIDQQVGPILRLPGMETEAQRVWDSPGSEVTRDQRFLRLAFDSHPRRRARVPQAQRREGARVLVDLFRADDPDPAALRARMAGESVLVRRAAALRALLAVAHGSPQPAVAARARAVRGVDPDPRRNPLQAALPPTARHLRDRLRRRRRAALLRGLRRPRERRPQ